MDGILANVGSVLGLVIVVFLGWVILMSRCSAFKVFDSNKSKVEGIPFYIKKGMVKQVTTYTRSWVEVTVNYHRLSGGEPVKGSERSATIYISESTYDQPELQNIFDKAEQAASNGFDAALKTFQKELLTSCNDSSKKNCEISPQTITTEADSATALSPTSSLLQALEANSSSYEAVVDYENTYYFNASVPPFGTTTASMKLAPDGTLTEVSSAVDTTKLAEVIPLQKLLMEKLGLGAAAPAILEDQAKKAKKAEKDYSLTLSANVNGYKYNLTKYHDYEVGLNLAPLQFDAKDISVTRTKFESAPKAQEEKKKKEISIEGSIVLPEDK